MATVLDLSGNSPRDPPKTDPHIPGNTNIGTALFSQLIGSGETVTVSTPLLSLTQTWNAAAVPFTGIKLNVTDTASDAASLLLDLQVAGSTKFNVRKDGSVVISSNFSALSGSVGAINFQSAGTTGALSFNGDVLIRRDAANILAQRNGVNEQILRVYETYTDATNYETGVLGWASGTLFIGSQKAGTGGDRPVQFQMGSTNIMKIDTTGHLTWNTDNTFDIGAAGATRPRNIYVAGSATLGGSITLGGNVALGGSLLSSANGSLISFPGSNTAQLGADLATPGAQTLQAASVVAGTSNTAGVNLTIAGSKGTGTGAGGSIILQVAAAGSTGTAQNALTTAMTVTSDKQVTFAGNAVFNGNIAAANNGSFYWNTQSVIQSPSNGVILFLDSAQTSFSRLQFGGTTSSFPAFKRSNAEVHARLADDSGYAVIRGNFFRSNSGTIWGDSGDGLAVIENTAGTDFGRLMFGGTTSSFPSLKRSGTALVVRVADDSADANLSAANLIASGSVYTAVNTVAGLPSATGQTGAMRFVSDALAPTFGATVVGGGAVPIPVYSDGTNWKVG